MGDNPASPHGGAHEELMARVDTSVPVPHVREPEQVRRFFDGLELIEPGVVPIHQWHPHPGGGGPPAVPALGGIGRKP